jgi:hypothetical protein
MTHPPTGPADVAASHWLPLVRRALGRPTCFCTCWAAGLAIGGPGVMREDSSNYNDRHNMLHFLLDTVGGLMM